MRWPPIIVVFLLIGVGLGVTPVAPAADAPHAGPRPEPHVVLISIDGLRPDVALRADMPNLRKMMAEGSFTFWATTTPAAITLPSHTSMLTGCVIEKHGISGNDDDVAAAKPILVPTIFDLCHAAGLSTAMVSGKSKFLIYAKPVDAYWVPTASKSYKRVRFGSTRPTLKQTTDDDADIGDRAVELLTEHKPRFLFVHFGIDDVIGHAKGWGSPAQIANLHTTDAAIGGILDALRKLGLYDQTTVLLSADHGGAGRVHGRNNDPSKFIPWVIKGPGVRKNFDLSLFHDRKIQTYDTFATICDVLGLKPPANIDGKSVTEAFDDVELLTSTTQPTTDPTPSTRPAKSP